MIAKVKAVVSKSTLDFWQGKSVVGQKVIKVFALRLCDCKLCCRTLSWLDYSLKASA